MNLKSCFTATKCSPASDKMNRMSRSRTTIVICLLLLLPKTAWAHALSPSYYPLGHCPVLLGAEWWPFFLIIPTSIAVATMVFWAWARRVGILGCLWRAAVCYIAARATETAVLFLFDSVSLFRHAGWSSSIAENIGPLILFLAAGLIVTLPVSLLVFRRSGMTAGVVVAATCTASLAGYLAAYGCSLMLMLVDRY